MKIGTDIIQIDRVRASCDKFGDRFKERFLCASEINLANKEESLAGFWAAKEAVAKALGCGIGEELSFHDIIIRKDRKGRPYFELSSKAQSRHGVIRSSLSISHDGGFAIAVVALETEKP
jgi:holo-[acyl-carrier protein] synthase